ncbi:flavin-dependent oxidoreductase [Aliiroseovarius sp.]|uniref:flavin-dependent oxidoreductase n=1 Tax=Aliiroseovarius sp. TaxID=1872442 RepID=UPI003BAAEBA2
MTNSDTQAHVLIAGGGIGGLALALTLDQIGVSFTVLESVRALRPLGVGINLQPNAVRELYALGIDQRDLDGVGVPAREWALVGRNGAEIHAEPRGLEAGYDWPQYAVHRGAFHMLLYRRLMERCGPDVLKLNARVTGYRQEGGTVTAFLEEGAPITGTILVGADGIHSKVRAQMHPGQPPIHWGGALMWRGCTRAKPVRTGSSFIGLGGARQRMVIYPISPVGKDGKADINWIAEVTHDDPDARDGAWFREAQVKEVLPHFMDWTYDWLDVPKLIRETQVLYENPMIDRDPVPTWQDGAVVLMGDAAHAMYPTGSNGASQAIIDARTMGAQMLSHGVTTGALAAYDAQLCGPVSELVLRNRGSGPFGLLDIVEERCRGLFRNIDSIIPKEEREAFIAGYKSAAGFAVAELNASPPIIAPGARVTA